ncbi:helix-turn-helix domain-containing protein [Microbacteriaceae bacterium VKM Ac-2854]|nr:helix-turn-helix domain-containing protein [Microbacteriaceae bacterium VKM Ac-2854]
MIDQPQPDPVGPSIHEFRGPSGLAVLSARRHSIHAPEPASFRATVHVVPLVRARVISFRAGAHTGTWGDGGSAEAMRFGFVVAGEVHTLLGEMEQPDLLGGVRILRPGQPVPYRSLGESHVITIELPTTAMPAGSDALVRAATPMLIGPTSLTRAAIAFVTSVFALPPRPDSDDAHHLERTIVSLIYAVLAESLAVTGEREDIDDVLYARAVQLIVNELASSELAVETLAASLGTSPRRLQRVFQNRGTTVSAEIRDRRLEAIAAAIRTGPLPGGFSALVAGYGFTGLDYVGRAFRTRFGMTMSAYRSRHGR